MARNLTATQKRILDKVSTDIISYDDLSKDVQLKLESVNDYETLWSDAERYLWDRAMNARYSR